MFNLLIVDDEIRVREGLKKLIDWNSLGFQVVADVESAKKAISYVEQNCIDVMLTDIIMPEMDGLELIGRVKEINSYIKTVILSGYGEFQYAQKALRLGAYDFLTKPVDFDDLKRIFWNIQAVLGEEITKQQEHQKLSNIVNPLKIAEGSKDKTAGLIIENAKKYIQEHFAEEITLDMLSHVLYIHPNYLSKLFKDKTGENFIDYLTKIRIDESKKLLRDVSLKIYEVSEMTGFCNPKYFGMIFKELAGMTPREFRDSIR